MVELDINEQLTELPQVLQQISHIQDVAPCGKAWIMDVLGRDQGAHMDGWEVEKSRQSMQMLDLSKCSIQCHNGFNTVIPTLSFVIYFNDSGGISFPRASLSKPMISAKRGRIVMFQNYDDTNRPAHNPKALHHGVYGQSFKRVMTAGVMSSETPLQLQGPEFANAPFTRGFLYAPIMHRPNTSCGDRYRDSPSPPPRPPAKLKELPVYQLLVRPADSEDAVVEASTLGGSIVGKVLVDRQMNVAALRSQLGVDPEAKLVCAGRILDASPTTLLGQTNIFDGLKKSTAAQTEDTTLVEWDVIDTIFAKKEIPEATAKADRPQLVSSSSRLLPWTPVQGPTPRTRTATGAGAPGTAATSGAVSSSTSQGISKPQTRNLPRLLPPLTRNSGEQRS